MEGLQLRSLVDGDTLRLSFARMPVAAPGPDEIVVRIDATPINPSDIGLLFGAADMAAAAFAGAGASATVTAPVPPAARGAMATRAGQSLTAGNEGAGGVIAAGANAKHLIGKLVAVRTGAMYAQYTTAKATDALVLPPGASAADGASAFINPLTALGMIETMRREGHTAVVHTAAASNLGQMLQKLCLAEGIPLVNIVRSDAQVEVLRAIGATHVLVSSRPSFATDLVAALAETGATLAFDAIGGGTLVTEILAAMEAVQLRKLTSYARYGSPTHKQVYIYGALDVAPTVVNRSFGMAWGIGGWLMTWFLAKVGPAEVARLGQRVARELTTTFASQYTKTIALTEMLSPEAIAGYRRRATGEKYLVAPSM